MQRISATSPELLPGTIWAEGRVHYPAGFTPAEDTRVWGHGAEWPDGTRWYGAEVAADGSFRMAFAEGTEVGSLHLQDWKCLAEVGSFRIWQKNSIEMVATEGHRVELKVVGKGVDLEELDYSLQFGNALGMPLQSGAPHTFRFALHANRSTIVHVLGIDFPVLDSEVRIADGVDPLVQELVLEKPARITGRLVPSTSETLDYPWVRVQLTAEPTAMNRLGKVVFVAQEKVLLETQEGSDLPDEASYTYSVEVPPGYAAKVMGNASSSLSAETTTEPLTAGETYELNDLFLAARGTVLLGRLVDTTGTPIAGAWIRANDHWNESGVYFSDPAQTADHEVQTDLNGEFSMQTRQLGDYTIQALVHPAGEAPNSSAKECRAGTRVQFFEIGGRSLGRQNFVFHPVEGGIRGEVKGPLAEPVKDFVVACQRVPDELGFGGCVVYTRDPSPYLPEGMQGDDWGSRDYHDSTIRFRFHSDNGQFLIPSLPSGNWEVTVLGDGYTSAYFPEVVVPGGELVLANLEVAGSLAVEVRDYSGQPRVGAEVVVESSVLSEIPYLTFLKLSRKMSQEGGRVLMEDLPAGRYKVAVAPLKSCAESSQFVDVIAGETTEILLQPMPCGEVFLKRPWSRHSIRVGPQLIGLEDGRVYSFEEHEYEDGFRLRDVVPGDYRLTYTFQSDKIKRLVEPVIRVQAFEQIEVPIQVSPGFIQVTCRVLVKGEPVRGGKLWLDYADGIADREEIYIRNGDFTVLLPDAMPQQVMRMNGYQCSPAREWGRPVHGMPWEVQVRTVQVEVALHDEQGNPVSPPRDRYRKLRIMAREGIGSSTGIAGEESILFDGVSPGEYSLQFIAPTEVFPWKAANDKRLVVTLDRPLLKWSVEVKRVTPVVGKVTATDWPVSDRAWICAWSNEACTRSIGKVRLDLNRDPQFELYGPDKDPFWISVETNGYSHNPEAQVFGPFEITALGSNPIRIPAYYVVPTSAENED
ncbi:MAG: carboxypeptidase regulatory-like domain-containing protein [Planctomycetes bacterium]|nr:carboxypeptidase regulatory-like domain-containing protein [Planctomycetota bacterium]